jgi:hypothetical protein
MIGIWGYGQAQMLRFLLSYKTFMKNGFLAVVVIAVLITTYLLVPKNIFAWSEGLSAPTQVGSSGDTNKVKITVYAKDFDTGNPITANFGWLCSEHPNTQVCPTVQNCPANCCNKQDSSVTSSYIVESCHHQALLVVTKSGYSSYSYTFNHEWSCPWAGTNGLAYDYSLYMKSNPPPATTNPSNLHIQENACYTTGTNGTPQVIFSWTPSSAGGTHIVEVNTSNNFTGARLRKDRGTNTSFTWDSAHPMDYAGFGAPANTPQNSTTYYWAVYADANGRYGYGGSFTTENCVSGGGGHGVTWGTLSVKVFYDSDGDGYWDSGEPNILTSSAPGTLVRRDSTSGPLLPFLDPSWLWYEEDLTAGRYTVYFKPDPNWVVTNYSDRFYGDTRFYGDNYNPTSNGYYYTESILITASETSQVYLGIVPKPALPDLIPQGLIVSGALQTGAPITFSGTIRNQGDGNAVASHASFTVDAAPLISTPAVLPLGPGDGQDVNTVSSPWTATLGTHTVTLCADSNNEVLNESKKGNNCITSPPFTISVPPEQWLKTEKGDVGVKGAINMAFHPLAQYNQNNVDYLALAENTINFTVFTSVKNWLIPNYPNITTPSLSIQPSSASSYKSLKDDYNKKNKIIPITRQQADDPTADIKWGFWPSIEAPASSGGIREGGVGEYVGDAAINDYVTDRRDWTGKPAVIFIDGNLQVWTNIYSGNDTGLIFIVSGDIEFCDGVCVWETDGIFITYGKFYTSNESYDSSYCAPSPNVNETKTLIIKGAVYSMNNHINSTCFTRNIGKAAGINNTTPAEKIIYEPKYLVLFRGLVGNTVTSFQETSP